MKVFVDTNVILDFLFDRDSTQATSTLFEKIENRNLDAYISIGSIYTITYLLEKCFKKNGLDKESRLSKVRECLKLLLANFRIVPISNRELVEALDNISFDDIEDSFQYQIAVISKCEAFLTQNIKDFPDNGEIKILTPQEFLK